MRKILVTAAILLVALVASRSDSLASNSNGFYLNQWLNQWVNVQAYENVQAYSWGSGAQFDGANNTYGRDWYYPGDTDLSVVYWQMGVTSGYKDCNGNNSYQQKWYTDDDKYYNEIPNDQVNNWHTVVDNHYTYPPNPLNPFDTCNSGTWRVNLYSQFVETSPQYVSRQAQYTGSGYIACIFNFFSFNWGCSLFF